MPTTGTLSPLGFTGEYTDAETGFVYLRARHYDPATGQFLTRDPLEALTRSPYGYVEGNPVNLTDPSGVGFGKGLVKGAGEPSRALGPTGTAFRRGVGAVLFGAVVADGTDPDDLAVDGELDGAGHDGHVDRAAGPRPSRSVVGAGEADVAAGIGDRERRWARWWADEHERREELRAAPPCPGAAGAGRGWPPAPPVDDLD